MSPSVTGTRDKRTTFAADVAPGSYTVYESHSNLTPVPTSHPLELYVKWLRRKTNATSSWYYISRRVGRSPRTLRVGQHHVRRVGRSRRSAAQPRTAEPSAAGAGIRSRPSLIPRACSAPTMAVRATCQMRKGRSRERCAHAHYDHHRCGERHRLRALEPRRVVGGASHLHGRACGWAPCGRLERKWQA